MSLNLHPKVGWPLVGNTLLGVVATVIAAWQRGGGAAALAATVSGVLIVAGALTGYTVPSGGWQPTAPTTPTSGGGTITMTGGPTT